MAQGEGLKGVAIVKQDLAISSQAEQDKARDYEAQKSPGSLDTCENTTSWAPAVSVPRVALLINLLITASKAFPACPASVATSIQRAGQEHLSPGTDCVDK